jgi:hypothetical protein
MVVTINGRDYTDSDLERISRQVECSVDEFAALQAWLARRIKANGGQRASN